MTSRHVCGLALALLFVCTGAAFGQGATSSISGTVVDSAGGAIPGVAVVVKNDAGVTFETVTNAEGIFNIPAVTPGAYSVTVSLAGFKTAVTEVRVAPGTWSR